MNIELLDENKVLIDLCDDDMEMLSIEYSSLSINSEKNRNIIQTLVDIAKVKTGLRSECYQKILIDTMPYEGGCFILITLKENSVLKGKKFRILKKPFEGLFLFENCEEMLCVIEKLYCNKFKNYESSLILYKGQYGLLIKSISAPKKSMIRILQEYSCQSYFGSIIMSHIKEHGKVITDKNAVEKAGSVLFKVGKPPENSADF